MRNVIIFVFCILTSLDIEAEVYKCTDAAGEVTLSDKPCKGVKKESILLPNSSSNNNKNTKNDASSSAPIKPLSASDVDGLELYEKVKNKYNSITTYRDQGIASSPSEFVAFNFERKFTTLYSNSGLFKQEWKDNYKAGICKGVRYGGIWYEGKGFNYYSSCGNYYNLNIKSYKNFNKLVSSYGNKNKHTNLILKVLMGGIDSVNYFKSDKKGFKILGEELLNGRETIVALLSKAPTLKYPEKYWIDKYKYIIHKYEIISREKYVTVNLHNIEVDNNIAINFNYNLPKGVVAIRRASNEIKSGRYKQAETILLKEASLGNKDAQASLGLLYAMFLKNTKKAREWIDKAAENCHPGSLKGMDNKYHPRTNREKWKYWKKKSNQCHNK